MKNYSNFPEILLWPMKIFNCPNWVLFSYSRLNYNRKLPCDCVSTQLRMFRLSRLHFSSKVRTGLTSCEDLMLMSLKLVSTFNDSVNLLLALIFSLSRLCAHVSFKVPKAMQWKVSFLIYYFVSFTVIRKKGWIMIVCLLSLCWSIST